MLAISSAPLPVVVDGLKLASTLRKRVAPNRQRCDICIRSRRTSTRALCLAQTAAGYGKLPGAKSGMGAVDHDLETFFSLLANAVALVQSLRFSLGTLHTRGL